MRFALIPLVLLAHATAFAAPVYRCTGSIGNDVVIVLVNAVAPNQFEARTTVTNSTGTALDSGVVPVKHFVNPDGGPSLWVNGAADYSLLVYEEQLGLGGKVESLDVTGGFIDVATGVFQVFDRAVLGCTVRR